MSDYGTPVRLLTHEEAKKKAAATALRAIADRWESEVAGLRTPVAHTIRSCASDARKEASKLWPPKRAAERGGAGER